MAHKIDKTYTSIHIQLVKIVQE